MNALNDHDLSIIRKNLLFQSLYSFAVLLKTNDDKHIIIGNDKYMQKIYEEYHKELYFICFLAKLYFSVLKNNIKKALKYAEGNS